MPFQRGKSGNPGGRPKENDDLKKLARTHTKEAIAKLVEWMRGENPKASVSACLALLDRGHGKPREHVHVEHTDRPLSYAERLAQERAADSRRTPEQPVGDSTLQ